MDVEGAIKVKTKFTVMAGLMVLLVVASPVSAHFLGNDSVDGREIRWEESTAYDDARIWAIDQWDALGKVNIAPDAWNTITDLDWGDVNYCDVTWDGRWVPRSGADAIQLNTCYFKNYGAFTRRAVATHEQGHALGLAHSFVPNVMNSPVQNSGVNTPQSHDRQDYFALWP
jgi:hypothetical protein